MNSSDINPRKMALLQEFQRMAKTTPPSDMLPLALAITRKAQDMGISFTKEEMQTIINSMRPNMSAKESSQIDMIMNMIK